MLKPIHIAAIVAAASAAATAQPIDSSFTYQGQLQDAGVNANGLYDINFALFASELGGLALASDLIEDVQVTDGLFTVDVDFGFAAFTPGQERWILVQVRLDGDSFQSLTPRQELTTTPFATFATASGTDLQDAYNNDSDITLSAPSFAGAINIRRQEDSSAIRFINSTTGFGGLTILGSKPDSTDTWAIYNDVPGNGNGMFFRDRLDTNSPGLTYEGLDGENRFSLSGATSFFAIDTDASNSDDRTILPTNSVNALETREEAGVTSATSTSLVVLTPSSATTDVIDSRSIAAPGDGYVLVIATAELQFSKSTTLDVRANFGVSNSSTLLPSNQDIEFIVEGALPNGQYDQPITVHGLFEVSQGVNTFYFLGNQTTSGQSLSCLDTQLTCLYVPTAYGIIEPTERGVPETDGFTQANQITAADIQAERQATEAINQARIDAEFAAMRARIDELEAKLDGKVMREGRIEDR